MGVEEESFEEEFAAEFVAVEFGFGVFLRYVGDDDAAGGWPAGFVCYDGRSDMPVDEGWRGEAAGAFFVRESISVGG